MDDSIVDATVAELVASPQRPRGTGNQKGKPAKDRANDNYRSKRNAQTQKKIDQSFEKLKDSMQLVKVQHVTLVEDRIFSLETIKIQTFTEYIVDVIFDRAPQLTTKHHYQNAQIKQALNLLMADLLITKIVKSYSKCEIEDESVTLLPAYRSMRTTLKEYLQKEISIPKPLFDTLSMVGKFELYSVKQNFFPVPYLCDSKFNTYFVLPLAQAFVMAPITLNDADRPTAWTYQLETEAEVEIARQSIPYYIKFGEAEIVEHERRRLVPEQVQNEAGELEIRQVQVPYFEYTFKFTYNDRGDLRGLWNRFAADARKYGMDAGFTKTSFDSLTIEGNANQLVCKHGDQYFTKAPESTAVEIEIGGSFFTPQHRPSHDNWNERVKTIRSVRPDKIWEELASSLSRYLQPE